jgi:lactam utilization protein B
VEGVIMQAYKYETFVRRAFSLRGTLIDRSGDPASLADTDVFSERKIDSVKAAIVYSMEIFNSEVENKCSIPDDESDNLENFIKQIINAANLQEISTILDSYIEKVEDKYFIRKDGLETLNSDF